MGKRKYTIELCQQIAKERDGLCLSEVYVNSKTNLKWKCSKGHEWNATMDNIRKGKWCASCKGVKKHTIELCHKIAEERKGKCLSEEYKGVFEKMKWQCSKGHEWDTCFHYIKNGNTWCPYCAGKYNNIELCQKVAEKKGGKCLSKVYKTASAQMKWQCSKGHVWNAKYNNIKTGYWCPYCAGTIKLTIEDCRKVAEERNGKCLSEEYVNIGSHLIWKCSEGHIWNATLAHVKHNKTWCGKCSKGKSEKLCRKILEELTQEKFPSVRPDFLKHYKTGWNLELDGYCEKLQIAFEYHGVQHYKYFPNFFHKKGKYQFEEQKERDKLKIELCDKNNIKLIIIPYCYDYTDEQKLREFITNSL